MASPRRSNSTTHRASNSITSPTRSTTAPPRGNGATTAAPPKKKEPEPDLLGGFGDDDAFSGGTGNGALATNKALPALDGAPSHQAFHDYILTHDLSMFRSR